MSVLSKILARKSKVQRSIDEIMECFDFDQVHHVMALLAWTWATTNNQVPTVDQLKAAALHQLQEVAGQREGWCVMCGGLKATNLGDGVLELDFILTSWDSMEG